MKVYQPMPRILNLAFSWQVVRNMLLVATKLKFKKSVWDGCVEHYFKTVAMLIHLQHAHIWENCKPQPPYNHASSRRHPLNENSLGDVGHLPTEMCSVLARMCMPTTDELDFWYDALVPNVGAHEKPGDTTMISSVHKSDEGTPILKSSRSGRIDAKLRELCLFFLLCLPGSQQRASGSFVRPDNHHCWWPSRYSA